MVPLSVKAEKKVLGKCVSLFRARGRAPICPKGQPRLRAISPSGHTGVGRRGQHHHHMIWMTGFLIAALSLFRNN